MPNDIDFEIYDPQELAALRVSLNETIAKRRAMMADAIALLDADPQAAVAPAKKAAKPRKAKAASDGNKAPVLYADDAGNTWSGRGRLPAWIVKAGGDKEAFRVRANGAA